MEKQQLVAKAWGDMYSSLKGAIDKNGWLDRRKTDQTDIFKGMSVGSLDFMGQHFVRPTKLKGIDNNEGWLKLEDPSVVEDLELGYYFAINNNPDTIWLKDKLTYHSDELKTLFERGCITHVQKVKEPKPPLF